MKHLLIGALALGLLPNAYAGEINISFSDDFAEKIEDDLGQREGEYLVKALKDDIEYAFGDDLALLGDINVTIENAVPNRPTFKQMGDTPGLSFQSFGVGGARVSAVVLDDKGEPLTELSYEWYESDIRWAQGSNTWTDAKRAFDRFARKLDTKADEARAEKEVG